MMTLEKTVLWIQNYVSPATQAKNNAKSILLYRPYAVGLVVMGGWEMEQYIRRSTHVKTKKSSIY